MQSCGGSRLDCVHTGDVGVCRRLALAERRRSATKGRPYGRPLRWQQIAEAAPSSASYERRLKKGIERLNYGEIMVAMSYQDIKAKLHLVSDRLMR